LEVFAYGICAVSIVRHLETVPHQKARIAAGRLGNHGGRLAGGRLRCHSPAGRATLWATMKFGFGTSEKNGVPRIERVSPAAAIPGGEVTLHGSGFASRGASKPVVRFGEAESGLSLVSANRIVARVPDGAFGGLVSIETGGHRSEPFPVAMAVQIS